MRGCLSVIVIAGAFVAGVIWQAGPPVASGVVTMALQGSGLSADRLDVKVTASRWNGNVAAVTPLEHTAVTVVDRHVPRTTIDLAPVIELADEHVQPSESHCCAPRSGCRSRPVSM